MKIRVRIETGVRVGRAPGPMRLAGIERSSIDAVGRLALVSASLRANRS